jgi:hypothetical protein
MENTINAKPTKKLVAYVLTKDILLEDAILDLIDNSIDGAKRLSVDNFKQFWVKITINKHQFTIKDNCGGIPLNIAKEYAFRFGRPDDYAALDDNSANAVGNFGVGMKRALLKMGKKIKIVSNTVENYFEIDIDVEQWLKNEEWTFEFSKLEHQLNPNLDLGTTITVDELYSGVSAKFGLSNFIDKLELLVKEKQIISIQKGLRIELNDQVLASHKIELLSSKDIKPIYKNFDLEIDDGKVSIQLYAGIEKSDNNKAGWYIICNGRTLLQADKSPVTGWGYNNDALRIPSYHNQYGQFRGYLFFKSNDIKTLPWNTTKSGVDQEHPAFRKAYQEMIAAMKEIFTFLNAVDKESDHEEQLLNDYIAKAKSIALDNITESTSFVYPVTASQTDKSKKLTWIRYQKPTEEVNRVMQVLEVTKPEDVGIQTFEIYYAVNVEAED